MRDNATFCYQYLFDDYMAKVSNDAKLLYVEMMFFAVEGFVASPRSIIDMRGYTIDALNELISTGEILTLPNRSEVFIASYYIHNYYKKNKYAWLKTPYGQYWRGKLWIKKNGVATFKPQENEKTDTYQPPRNEPYGNFKTKVLEGNYNQDILKPNSAPLENEHDTSWDDLLNNIEIPTKA